MRKVVEVDFSKKNQQTGDDKDNKNIDGGDTMQSRSDDLMKSGKGDNNVDDYNGDSCDTLKTIGIVHDAEYVKRVSYKWYWYI